MPIRVGSYLYKCAWCGKPHHSKGKAERHEAGCFKNAARTPFLGELTHIAQTGQMRAVGTPDAIGRTSTEWVYHDTMPSWWPTPHEPTDGVGMIWIGDGWVAVDGYSCSIFADGNEPMELWPRFDGQSLALMHTWERLHHLDLCSCMEECRQCRAEQWREMVDAEPKTYFCPTCQRPLTNHGYGVLTCLGCGNVVSLDDFGG
jgi:hypothetical protein